MPAITKILAPVDFSDGSRAALSWASFMAERFGARLEVLHVWEPAAHITPSEILWLGSSDDHAELAKRMTRDLTDKLETFVAEVLGEGAKVGMHVEAGYPSHSILSWLESRGYDLAVLGTHGRTGLPHLLMGSVSERIVRTSPCAVLTVRADTKEQRAAEKQGSP